jgi:hypothetical protein
MRQATVVSALGLALLAGAGPAAAQVETPSRARLFVNGAFSLGGLDYSETRSYTLFAEESTLDADYTADSAPGFELGLRYNFRRGLGAEVAFSKTDRDGSVVVQTGLPHPFLFDQPREVSRTQDGFPYDETAFHFDLAYTKRSGSLELFAFGGGSLIKVKATVVGANLSVSQQYPFDTATLNALPSTTLEDTPFGFNVGGGLDYVMGRFGLGGQVRYSRATAKLVPSEGNTLEVSAGGFQAAVGVRLFF